MKELQSYREEAVELKKRADAMEAAGEDEYEVRQQVRSACSTRRPQRRQLTLHSAMSSLPQRKVQAESQQMIPDTEKRLAKAVAELEELVVRPRLAPHLLCSLLTRSSPQANAEDELAETEEFKKAEAALKLAKPE